MNAYRFEGEFVKELPSDKEAFEYACGWYDERDASIERWIGPKIGWVKHSDPLYHPQHYYGNKDGGWMMPDGSLLNVDF